MPSKGNLTFNPSGTLFRMLIDAACQLIGFVICNSSYVFSNTCAHSVQWRGLHAHRCCLGMCGELTCQAQSMLVACHSLVSLQPASLCMGTPVCKLFLMTIFSKCIVYVQTTAYLASWSVICLQHSVASHQDSSR